MRIDIYYAADQSGQGKVFLTKPERSVNQNNMGIWKGEGHTAVTLFLELMVTQGRLSLPSVTWEDEPLVIRVRVRKPVRRHFFLI